MQLLPFWEPIFNFVLVCTIELVEAESSNYFTGFLAMDSFYQAFFCYFKSSTWKSSSLPVVYDISSETCWNRFFFFYLQNFMVLWWCHFIISWRPLLIFYTHLIVDTLSWSSIFVSLDCKTNYCIWFLSFCSCLYTNEKKDSGWIFNPWRYYNVLFVQFI